MRNLIRLTLAGAIGLILAVACSAPVVSPTPSPMQPRATATPAPTSTVTTTEWVVFYARDLEDPVPVTVMGPVAASDPISQLRTRLEVLARANTRGPGESFNVVAAAKAMLAGVTVGGDLATLDYSVPGDDWGINGSATLKAYLQQVVFTATVQKGVARVLITQNGGQRAIIGGEGLVIDHPATRESVATDRSDRSGVYFARDQQAPVLVFVEGNAGTGATPEDRIKSRLLTLAGTRSQPAAPGAFNVLPLVKAEIATISKTGDLVKIDYTVPGDDWGINGSATLKAFVQQVVYTATEEPGTAQVLITQNGGRLAIIGGEGLTISQPQTRASVLR
jgi:spore germination protein GerM